MTFGSSVCCCSKSKVLPFFGWCRHTSIGSRSSRVKGGIPLACTSYWNRFFQPVAAAVEPSIFQWGNPPMLWSYSLASRWILVPRGWKSAANIPITVRRTTIRRRFFPPPISDIEKISAMSPNASHVMNNRITFLDTKKNQQSAFDERHSKVVGANGGERPRYCS